MAAGHQAGALVTVMSVGIATHVVAAAAGRAGPATGEILVAAVAAVPFCAGRLSPDADLTWLARFGHRRTVHWPGWPLIVMAWLFIATHGGAPFVAYAPALGWLSHLVPCDVLFGKGGGSIPKGVPLLPFRGSPRVGTGLRVSAANTGLSRALVGDRRHSVLEFAATAAFAAIAAVEAAALVARGS